MATIKGVTTYPTRSVARTIWETLTSANAVGSGEALDRHPDKTVQLTGTFGSATVIMQGSNDGGTTYFTLQDAQGDALSFTAAGGNVILENPALIRPSASGGDGTQDIDVILISRG